MAMHGLTAKGPPPNAPKFLLYIKIAILALSVIILALSIYSLAIFGGGSGGLLIFVVIKTFLIYGILTFLEFKMPHLFFRLVAVIAYAISLVFWLSAWAWSAAIAGLWLHYSSVYGSLYSSSYYYYGNYGAAGAALAACAGLGAVVWVLSIVHLVIFIRACLADKTAGVAPHQAELGQVQKPEATSTVYATTSPAPVQYQQPAQYQQAPAQYPQGAYQQPAAQHPQPYVTQ